MSKMPFLATKYKDMLAVSPDGMSFFGNTRCLIWAVLLTGIVHPGAAQTQTYRGVVWDPPADPVQAEATMRQMHAMGVNAIRMPLLRDERLLTLADTLGLHLFQELPLDYLSAEALRDTLGYATRLLELVLNDARAHPSVRHIGLARHSDTSDSTACWLLDDGFAMCAGWNFDGEVGFPTDSGAGQRNPGYVQTWLAG